MISLNINVVYLTTVLIYMLSHSLMSVIAWHCSLVISIDSLAVVDD